MSSHHISAHLISSHLISTHLLSSQLISSHPISSHRTSHLISCHLNSSNHSTSHHITNQPGSSMWTSNFSRPSFLRRSFTVRPNETRVSRRTCPDVPYVRVRERGYICIYVYIWTYGNMKRRQNELVPKVKSKNRRFSICRDLVCIERRVSRVRIVAIMIVMTV